MSSSQSVIELLPAAIEAITIAFRIGVLVTEVRNQIEQDGDDSPSWSAVVSGFQESDALKTLEKFHNEKVKSKQS